jgi:hypothetical protein
MTFVRRVLDRLHPLLFAAALPLSVAARFTGQYGAADLAIVAGACALAAALVLAGVALLLRSARRGRETGGLAPLVALLVVGWFFYAVPLQRAVLAVSWRLSRPTVLIPLGIVATTAAIWWLVRQQAETRARVNRFFGVAGAALVAMALVQIGAGERASRPADRSQLVRSLAEPVPLDGAAPGAAAGALRDIYLIVLDGRANAGILREQLGVDETSLEDSLRALGFFIPREMYSNYTQTHLSLPSLLNFEHVTQLTQDAGANSTDRAIPKQLIEDNRAARFLKARGYRYVFFPSTWFNLTEHSPLADIEFDAWPRFSFTSAARRTELRVAVGNWTLVRGLLESNRADARHHLRTFAGLRQLTADPAPTFAFAHVVLPHVPYVFEADCAPRKRAIIEEDSSAEQRQAYLDQTRCANRLVLGFVHAALARRTRPQPIILVVSDHGSRFSDVKYYEHPERVSSEFVRERFGAFGAFYLPDGGERALGERVSLVNVMRGVLRYYFGAALPPLADTRYVSGDRPYRFYPVADGPVAP